MEKSRFRVIKDKHMKIWYIQKRFFFWWIKWSISKTNLANEIHQIPIIMEKGHYEFGGGQYGNYYYIMDKGYFIEEFFDTPQHFKDEYAEYLI